MSALKEQGKGERNTFIFIKPQKQRSRSKISGLGIFIFWYQIVQYLQHCDNSDAHCHQKKCIDFWLQKSQICADNGDYQNLKFE